MFRFGSTVCLNLCKHANSTPVHFQRFQVSIQHHYAAQQIRLVHIKRPDEEKEQLARLDNIEERTEEDFQRVRLKNEQPPEPGEAIRHMIKFERFSNGTGQLSLEVCPAVVYEQLEQQEKAKAIPLVDKRLKKEETWKDVPPLTVASTLDHYTKLSKLKLTALVVSTTLAGFYMGAAPGAMNYSLLASTLIGTTLTSGSAAAWNHYLEVPFDSQMKRTQDRPLVRGLISPLHAASFAFVSGAAGLTILATCVNPLTAVLGGINLCLYSFIYTPMKRVHIANTWVGAIVGAIPPVMGFTAINNAIDLPSILLGLVLYSWQFPHFNALSWNMRHEYARAGYRMMSVTDPKICKNTALRHSVILLGATSAMCLTGMTHWSFGIDTLPFSLYLIYLAYRFRADASSKTSRKLFLYSLIYLPVIMFLMAISKNRNPDKTKAKVSAASTTTTAIATATTEATAA